VARITASASTTSPESQTARNGRRERSSETTTSDRISVPMTRAWASIRAIRSGPCTETSPIQFSTSVVMVSCPPGWMPWISSGSSMARAA